MKQERRGVSMRRLIPVLTIILVGVPMAAAPQSRIVNATVETDAVPGPVEYAVLLPDGYSETSDPVPLVLLLHGGGGSRDWLSGQKSMIDPLWADGSLPPLVFAMPSAGLSFYMNFKDDSERWEDFILEDFLSHLRSSYQVQSTRESTVVMGPSMGGAGSLLMAFKHPERFAAVVSLEPAIHPVLTWDELQPKHLFWLGNDYLEQLFGSPIDGEYWEANNPASIVRARSDRIRRSGLQIYLEAGDRDGLWLYEGAEFLHRTLWDAKIPHEYHLVRGADHVGVTLPRRLTEAFRFVGRVLSGPTDDPAADALRERFEEQKQGLGESDHYGLDRVR